MLTDIVNTYLSVRRAVGFKLHSVEKCLWNYANFATARGDIRVLSTTAVEWAALASSENQRANRLKVLIRFARFARAEDSGHEIPPDNIFCSQCALEASPDTRDRITRHMLALSTYMGHARLESTYWYLESTPQLMADIADLCESFTLGGSR